MQNKIIGKSNDRISAIGMGTMGIGGFFSKDSSQDNFFINVLKRGIDLGLTLIDTAEAYGAGHSEDLIGYAIKDCRKKVFVATKVSPEHLSYEDVIKSAEGSLRRLQTDYIDLYQIHWPNPIIPMEETFRALENLVNDGKVRQVGVSNFSLKQLKSANEIFFKGRIASLEVEYNLFDRTIENEILPYCEQNNITVIAYSPLDHGRISDIDVKSKIMQNIAQKYNKTIAQIILQWLITKPPVVAIPKASSIDHLKENADAADFDLDKEDVESIDQTFKTTVVNLPTDQIEVDKKGLDKFSPGPEDLAKLIMAGDTIKPIRVIVSQDASQKYKYKLTEGKLRYWAWVFAHQGKMPIPALIRFN